ncbi:MAG: molybdopterin molybdenumtransferase MoeA [Betaproteobacteria bacterium CG2_30_59_46]|nr:MAG: molybdopterin molybdenumtransferase MoeA [Betaproteobacteria bacterium CG2_30_59_46]PIQ14106.1 MAG: molybdopterin molybdenumtransferase MoeA [Hydrogenophilales bacterium CG18_big_fil_WC_8_21_14_2_50_58_12]PIX98504.1 MAG: molybdopterin molybdenumtransferase MoeA [Hydrogenophilales bacterium CG_4_10_14_3_um_filter_58_23]PJB06816.1 MAG: molybdopterin molybdenumtransferase MoeA [Hydrogenophilales bacterium CG_4_9_14_3_um_filter_59_35]
MDKKPNLLSADEALAFLLARVQPANKTEQIATADALGRVLAERLTSAVNVPPLDNSAMDGYAVQIADLVNASTRLRVTQRIPAGTVGQPLEAGLAARIFTGAPVPAGCDAVVMQEYCGVEGDTVTVSKPPKMGENIRRSGEDIAAGAEILPAGIRLRPQEMGLAASVGIASLLVYRKLKVATFFTGDEIVMPGEPLKPGQIYNSNRFVLTGLLQALGCEVVDLGIVPDNFAATVKVLETAASGADLIITSGGVSVGEEDHVKAAVEAVGKLDLWKIAIKPGKPLAFGEVGEVPFIGLPGNPVSAFVTFCLFVRPFILRSQGIAAAAPQAFSLKADFDWLKPGKRREFLRARLHAAENGEMGVQLYPHQGSGVLTSTVWADGLVEVPEGTPIHRGETVKFLPFTGLLN